MAGVLEFEPFSFPQPQERQHDGQYHGEVDYVVVGGSELAYAKECGHGVRKTRYRRNNGKVEHDESQPPYGRVDPVGNRC